MSDIEAPSLSCVACGVALRVDPEARAARCRHCGTESPVPEAMRQQARAHRLAIEAELRRLSFSESFARGMQSGAVDRLARIYGIVIALLSGVFTLGMMAPQFGADEVVVYIAIGVFAGGLALSMGLFFLALRWAVRKDALDEDAAPPPPVTPSGDLAVASVKGPCSACGASVPFLLGAGTARCPYCGTTVLPTEAIRAKLQGLASFRADLEQGRTSRSFARDQASSKLWRGIEWGLRRMGLFFPLIIGVFMGNALLRSTPPPPGRPVRKPPPVDETMQIIGASVLGGGVLLTLLLVTGSALLGRARRRTPRVVALEALAQVYGARVHEDGTRAAIEWLDGHWASGTPEGSLVVHNSDDGQPVERVVAAVIHRGVPALFVLAEAPHVRRFDAFVAGYAPSRAERGPSPAAAELRAAGLMVTLDQAGVHLAFPSSDGRFCQPGAAAWMLDRAAQIVSSPT